MPELSARNRSIDAGGTTSPPVHTNGIRLNAAVASALNESNNAAANTAEEKSCSATSFSSIAASIGPGGATTNSPPDSNGVHNSYTDGSNACGECVNTRLRSAARHVVSAMNAATLAWETATPFGSPVEPDVYITYIN